MRLYCFVGDRIECSRANKEKAKLALPFQERVQFERGVLGSTVAFVGDLTHGTADNTNVAFIEIVTNEFRFIESAGSLTD